MKGKRGMQLLRGSEEKHIGNQAEVKGGCADRTGVMTPKWGMKDDGEMRGHSGE